MEHAPLSQAGLRDSALQLAATAVDIGRTRLQLAATELEEERLRLAQRWIAAAGTLYFGSLALLLGCAGIVWATPPGYRLLALCALALLFAALCAAAAWRWRTLQKRKPALLAATLGELARDAQALRDGCTR